MVKVFRESLSIGFVVALILILFVVYTFFSGGYAQSKKLFTESSSTEPELGFQPFGGVSALTFATDTLVPGGFFNCNFVIYTSDNGGYVAGTNGYGDLEKVEFYEYTGGGSITEMLIWFVAKAQAANPDNVTGLVYDVTANGNPGNVLGTTTVPMTGIDTTGSLTSFVFSPPITVGDSFFVGIRMSTTPGDTVGIIMTEENCLSMTNAWELWSDGTTWTRFDDPISWELVSDMGIFPVITTPSGIDDIVNLPGNFVLKQNYPNPFNPATTIAYDLHKSADVTIKIYNLAGQEVKTLLKGKQPAGSKQVTWDGRDNNGHQVASGVYLYRLQADNTVQTRKMVLLK
jgi:hypothetical protein